MRLGILDKLIYKGENGYLYNWEEIIKIPEFSKLMETPQTKKWHGEGNVWVHTGLVCQEAICVAKRNRYEGENAYVFLGSALFHDIGKGVTTRLNKKGDWSSHGHDDEGEKITRKLLWDTDFQIRERICRLVKMHMKPLVMWDRSDKLGEIMKILNSRVDPHMLSELKRCDQKGSKPYRDYNVGEDFKRIDAFEEWATKLLPVSDDLIKNGGELYDENSSVMDRYAVVMMGLPGSGKNTYIDRFFNGPGYKQVSRDDIRIELGYCKPGEKYLGTKEEEEKVSKIFFDRFISALEDRDVPILNNTNLKRKYRDEYKKVLDGFYKVHWVYIYVEAEGLDENKRRRKGQIPDGVFDHMISGLEAPEIGECEQIKVFISRNDNFEEVCLKR